MTNRSLPWPRSEYISIQPGDLEPGPPTPEQRIRVVASLATLMRDANMTKEWTAINAEMLRILLVCDNYVWSREIHSVADAFGRNLAYDSTDPKTRFDQIQHAYSHR